MVDGSTSVDDPSHRLVLVVLVWVLAYPTLTGQVPIASRERLVIAATGTQTAHSAASHQSANLVRGVPSVIIDLDCESHDSSSDHDSASSCQSTSESHAMRMSPISPPGRSPSGPLRTSSKALRI